MNKQSQTNKTIKIRLVFVLCICFFKPMFSQFGEYSSEDYKKLDIKGKVALVESRTLIVKSWNFNEKNFPSVEFVPEVRNKTKKKFDKNGNLIYEEYKLLSLSNSLEYPNEEAHLYEYSESLLPIDSTIEKHQYDKNNNKIKSVLFEFSSMYGDTNITNKTTTFKYNKANNKIQTQIFIDHDKLEYKSLHKYDDKGRITTEEEFFYDTTGTLSSGIKRVYKFDNNDNIVEMKAYDNKNKIIEELVPEFDQNHSLVKTITYFEPHGTKDIGEIKEYDKHGNITLEKTCFSSDCKSFTSKKYNKKKLLIESNEYYDMDENPKNDKIIYTYNEDKKLTEEVHYTNDVLSEKHISTYNKAGLKVEEHKVEYYKHKPGRNIYDEYIEYDDQNNWTKKFMITYMYDYSYGEIIYFYEKEERNIVYFKP